jgi:hypothetical protein
MLTIIFDCCECSHADQMHSPIDEMPTETAIVEYFAARGWTLTESGDALLTHCAGCARAMRAKAAAATRRTPSERSAFNALAGVFCGMDPR